MSQPERTFPLPEDLAPVLKTLPKAFVVGGAVRDWQLGICPKDIDVEVYQTGPDQLKNHLAQYGRVDEVGKAFGVLKLTTTSDTYDFALPRADSKTEGGHTGFVARFDPDMTPKEAAKRRDLTINSMAWDPKNQMLIDPYGGLEDLQRRIIRHTSDHFPEDPLRPLRCIQFAARFGMSVAPETASLCRDMAGAGAFHELPKERVSEEFTKLLLKGTDYKKGFEALWEVGWARFFPEIEALYGLEQDKEYHPEGDVITHTAHCLAALKKTASWQAADGPTKQLLCFAVLCHDLGKATTTKTEWKEKAGRMVVTSAGHEQVGGPLTISLSEKIGYPPTLAEQAALLVTHHMAHLQVKSEKDVLALAMRLSPSNPHAPNARITTTIRQLSAVVEADHAGRPPLPKELPKNMADILEKAERLGCLDGPQPTLINGKILADEPLPPGRAVGEIIKAAYAAQISLEFQTKPAALLWVKKNKRRILAQTKTGPTPLINGTDLIKAGVPRGPDLKRLSNKAYELQLSGKLQSPADAIKALQADIAELTGPTP